MTESSILQHSLCKNWYKWECKNKYPLITKFFSRLQICIAREVVKNSYSLSSTNTNCAHDLMERRQFASDIVVTQVSYNLCHYGSTKTDPESGNKPSSSKNNYSILPRVKSKNHPNCRDKISQHHQLDCSQVLGNLTTDQS